MYCPEYHIKYKDHPDFLKPCLQLEIEEALWPKAVFKLIDGGFKCEECNVKYISGGDLVNH